MPAVSIITPAYRAQDFIARAVKSVLAQTLTDWEMIVVSDDDTDYRNHLQTTGIDDVRLRFASTGGIGKGAGYARNVGLAAASADIIAMLDADDIFYSSKLERMVPMALRHGFCTCALKHVRYANSVKQLIRNTGIGADGKLGSHAYLRVNYSANAMLVFDRKKVPVSWRDDLAVMEDLVFSMCAFNYLPVIYHIGEALHEYIQTPNSLSTAREAPVRFIAAKRRILQMLEDGALGVAQPEAIDAFRQFIHLSLETEKRYAQAMARGENITFTELLEERLQQQ